APKKTEAPPGVSQMKGVRTASRRQAAPVPNSTAMNTGVTATTLIEFIAAIPCDGERRASAFITNDENPKKTPAFKPHPRAEANVNARIHRLFTVALLHQREVGERRPRLR